MGEKARKVTIKDIAAECGVSTVTVSRMLAGHGSVSDATKEKIRDTMRRLNYPLREQLYPDHDRHDGKVIMILLDDMTAATKQKLITSLCNEIIAVNYVPALCYGPASSWKDYIEAMHGSAAGIVAISVLGDQIDALEDLGMQQIPLVAIHRCVVWGAVDSVVTDDYRSAETAVELLVELGHKNIALINIPHGLAGAFEVESGYRAALNNCGIPMNETYLHTCSFKRKDGMLIAKRIQEETPEVTAVIAVNGIIAKGVLDSYSMRPETAVPEYLSLVTFDVMEDSEYDDNGVQITAVGSQPADIARESIKIIAQNIQNPEIRSSDSATRNLKLIMKVALFEGNTTARVRGADKG